MALNDAKLSAEGKTMADLRITGVTNNQLELAAPDGTRHYLEITDDLLKALKPKPEALPATLSPREIQAEIRIGTTVAELATRSGVSEDLINRFAAPILSELAHIVVLARNIRLSLAGDRFTDPTQIEFGRVMDERLEANGAKNIRWVANKSLEGDWLVSAEYSHNSTAGKATWSFDPKNLFLVPENQSAMQLSNALPLSSHGTTEAESKVHPTYAPALTTEPEVLQEPTPTAGLTIVPELVELEVETVEVETRTEVISIAETESRTTFHVVEDEESLGASENIFSEELYNFEEEPPFVEPITEAEVGQVEEQRPEEPVQPKTQSTSRWAEVLFGTKDEED